MTWAAQRIICGAIENPFRGAVEAGDPSVAVHRENALCDGIQDRLHLVSLFP